MYRMWRATMTALRVCCPFLPKWNTFTITHTAGYYTDAGGKAARILMSARWNSRLYIQ